MNDFRWVSASISHVGNVRSVNEDSILDMPHAGLWSVADGMGGYRAGDVASQLIVDHLKQVEGESNLGSAVEDVQRRLHESNRQLIEYANQTNAGSPVGSTVVTLLVREGTAALLWVGDSRIYRLREGALQQMTRDHSAVEDLIAEGVLERKDAESHPSANIITRAVGGHEELEIDVAYDELRDKDMYLLCSDGLSKELSDAEIMTIMNKGNVNDVCEVLLGSTLQQQGKDNVSIIIVEFSETF